MSFEGYYQIVCKNGHYTEIDVYDTTDDDKCIDCHQDIIFRNLVDETNCENSGYVRIPTDRVYNVDKKFFEKYLSSEYRIEYFKKRNKNLIDPIHIEFNKKEYPLEKLAELFCYFDPTKELKIEISLKSDEGGNVVPYVIATFGKSNYDIYSKEFEKTGIQWIPLYIDEYGQECDECYKNAYECYEYSYDADIYYIVFLLYKNMWNRCFAYKLKE